MIASSRQMASSMKVKRILDLSSGILKQLLNVLAMAANMVGKIRKLKSEIRSPRLERKTVREKETKEPRAGPLLKGYRTWTC